MGEKMNNKGNAVVEATIILPFFIFGMLAFFHMGRAKLAEQIIYEAAIETAEYLAEEAYLELYNPVTPYAKFKQYIDDVALIDKYIQNGVDGIEINGYTEPDENNQITISIRYKTKIMVPLFDELTSSHVCEITQQVYTGYKNPTSEGDDTDEESYVFVTDNREVYHISRDCSHLRLSIHLAPMTAVCDEYTPCEFCGKANESDQVFITDEGNRYHSSICCSGLKRTVYRVKKSTVGGLPGCSRCAN